MPHRPSLQDLAFIKSLEAFEIAAGTFSHRDHIRMAYTYLCDHKISAGCTTIRQVLHGFLVHHGIEPYAKYHETLTQGWARIVRHHMDLTPSQTSADDFIDENPDLLDSTLIKKHYSDTLLNSQLARKTFVEPDLIPFSDKAERNPLNATVKDAGR